MSEPRTDPDTGSKPRSRLRVFGLWAREIAIVVVGALIASTLLRVFIAQMFVIPSGSMETTLLVRDRVMVQKVAGWQRGDVVVFRDTQDWLSTRHEDDSVLRKTLVFLGLAPDESTNHLIKRVIGMPGDHVKCCDIQGRITVNDYPLDEKDYLYVGADGVQVDPSTVTFDLVVPADRIFVMGDHRNNSFDSRCHLADQRPGKPEGDAAFVPMANVVGSTVAVVFPFNRWRTLSRPATFSGVPPGGTPPAKPVINGDVPRC